MPNVKNSVIESWIEPDFTDLWTIRASAKSASVVQNASSDSYPQKRHLTLATVRGWKAVEGHQLVAILRQLLGRLRLLLAAGVDKALERGLGIIPGLKPSRSAAAPAWLGAGRFRAGRSGCCPSCAAGSAGGGCADTPGPARPRIPAHRRRPPASTRSCRDPSGPSAPRASCRPTHARRPRPPKAARTDRPLAIAPSPRSTAPPGATRTRPRTLARHLGRRIGEIVVRFKRNSAVPAHERHAPLV